MSKNGRIETRSGFEIQTFFRPVSKNWGFQVLDCSEVERSRIDRGYASIHELLEVGFKSELEAYDVALLAIDKLVLDKLAEFEAVVK